MLKTCPRGRMFPIWSPWGWSWTIPYLPLMMWAKPGPMLLSSGLRRLILYQLPFGVSFTWSGKCVWGLGGYVKKVKFNCSTPKFDMVSGWLVCKCRFKFVVFLPVIVASHGLQTVLTSNVKCVDMSVLLFLRSVVIFVLPFVRKGFHLLPLWRG